MADEDWGIDFEAEIAIVVGDVPMGVAVEDAEHKYALHWQLNKWSTNNKRLTCEQENTARLTTSP